MPSRPIIWSWLSATLRAHSRRRGSKAPACSAIFLAGVACCTMRHERFRAGVKEYVVVTLRQRRVYWFVRRDERFVELQPGADGILRSEVFPGLWLDPAALLRGNRRRVLEVLRQGLATPEHAAFVARLAS